MGITAAIIVAGSLGGGLYFGGVFSSSNNSETILEKIKKESKELNQVPEYLASYNSIATLRDDKYGYSCEFAKSTNNQILDLRGASGKEKSADIVCVYMNKNINLMLNLFPIITFQNLRHLLGKLDGNGFDAFNVPVTTANLIKLDQKARANAELITDKIINQLSYGSEFALLDEIIFAAEFSTQMENVAGFYQSLPYMNFGWWNEQTKLPENNSRRIEIKMKQPSAFEADGTIDAVSYLDNILYTFAHEYGHHLTLYNNRFKEPNSFINELRKVFSNNAKDFRDFEKIYKYFNNLNDDEPLNNYNAFQNLDQKSDADKQVIIEKKNLVLEIYRNKYLGNVTSLINEFPEITGGDLSNEIKQNLLELKSPPLGIDDPVFSKLVDLINKALGSGTEINQAGYEELRQYLTDSPIYVYYLDLNQVFNLDGNSFFPKQYYFLPSSFSEVVNSEGFNANGQNGATIGDIFGNDIDVENSLISSIEGHKTFKVLATKDNACSSLPLTFANVGHTNFEVFLFDKELKNNQSDQYQEVSKSHDKEIMKELSYYYSKNELLARLHATLTHRYEKRTILTACAFKSGIAFDNEDKKHTSGSPDNIGEGQGLYFDYSLFKAWGMDVLNENNAQKLVNVLVKNKNISSNDNDNSNDFTIIPNNRPALGKNGKEKKNFFLSFNILNEEHSEYIYPWSSMYLLGHINNPNIDMNNILLEYDYGGNLFYKKPLNYNYNNFQYYVSNNPHDLLTKNREDFNKQQLFSDGNHLMLAFPLYSLKGKFFSNQSVQLNTIIQNYQDAQKKLGKPKRIFIDTNQNTVFDEGDIPLTISS